MKNNFSSTSHFQTFVAEKPTAITVLGVLNCVFGGIGILSAPISIFRMISGSKTIEIVWEYKIWLLVDSIAGIGFSAWLLALGISLLKFKRWVRRSSVIYSIIVIVRHIIRSVLYLAALSLGWFTMAQNQWIAVIVGIFSLPLGLIYPVLLLIFMNTAKVKQAFKSKEQAI